MGLAFLDVLCCGLGSAVFLLLVIQHGPSSFWTPDADLVTTQMASARDRVAATEQQVTNLELALAARAEDIRRRLAALEALAGLQSVRQQQAREAAAALRGEQQHLDAKKEAVQVLNKIREEEAKEQEHEGQLHLTGLSVGDDRVAIFLDSSSSMLDEKLVQIIRLRVSSDALKSVAPKWVKAKDAARWLHERLPLEKNFRLLTYSDRVRELNGTEVSGTTLAWQTKTSGQDKTIERALQGVIPTGATNLKRVFEVAAMLNPPPKQIILVTDGLPTLPGGVTLGKLKKCRNPKRGTVPMITAECRLSIFEHARATARGRLRNVQIDVILLPLEGDSNAVGAYWSLTIGNGGRLLTPAADWPSL